MLTASLLFLWCNCRRRFFYWCATEREGRDVRPTCMQETVALRRVQHHRREVDFFSELFRQTKMKASPYVWTLQIATRAYTTTDRFHPCPDRPKTQVYNLPHSPHPPSPSPSPSPSSPWNSDSSLPFSRFSWPPLPLLPPAADSVDPSPAKIFRSADVKSSISSQMSSLHPCNPRGVVTNYKTVRFSEYYYTTKVMVQKTVPSYHQYSSPALE